MNEGHRIECRKLEPGSGREIADLHCDAFPERQLRYSIFASSKVGKFIDTLISDPMHDFVGAFEDNALVGYTHVRYVEGQPHLNYIAVDTPHRGNGIGRVLLRALVDQSKSNCCKSITLDVLESSERARSWYLREAFTDASSSNTYLATATQALGVSKDQIGVSTSDSQLQKMEQFEISDINISIDNRHFLVGVIGKRLYRVGVDHDQRLIDVLNMTDEQRETIVVVPSQDYLNCAAELVDRNIRMIRSL